MRQKQNDAKEIKELKFKFERERERSKEWEYKVDELKQKLELTQ